MQLSNVTLPSSITGLAADIAQDSQLPAKGQPHQPIHLIQQVALCLLFLGEHAVEVELGCLALSTCWQSSYGSSTRVCFGGHAVELQIAGKLRWDVDLSQLRQHLRGSQPGCDPVIAHRKLLFTRVSRLGASAVQHEAIRAFPPRLSRSLVHA